LTAPVAPPAQAVLTREWIVASVSGGGIKAWDGTIQKALQLDFHTVIPGHGPVSKKADLVKWMREGHVRQSRLFELRSCWRARFWK
jgi:hypothetical protein